MSSTDAVGALPARAQRADARRNLDALLVAARDVFGESGVDAPVREIAARAGVGVGTVYRHFPQRSDLIVAVFRREVDACAAEAPRLAAEYDADEALVRWVHRFTGFVAAKQGLSPALHSGDPIYLPLRDYFEARFTPTLSDLLTGAAATGRIRDDVSPVELLNAVSRLCDSPAADSESSMRMVDLLLDGLRRGASTPD